MAKEKEQTSATFKVGVNLSDERRFEAGDAVPSDIKKADLDELKKLDAIEGK
jgi:hypothetical protein